jgi:hypothetical protein
VPEKRGEAMSSVVEIEARRSKKSMPSFIRLTKVLTDPDLPLNASERIIALVIFQHVSIKDMKCFPSVDTICRRAKVSKNTVYRTIRKLQELKLMTVEKRRNNGKFERNIYDFSILKTSTHCVPR